MFFSLTMKHAVLLATPLTALVVSENNISKRFDTVPFAPAPPEQGGYSVCATESHHKANYTYPANMLDCLEIGMWAVNHNGMWILKATTNPDNLEDWHVLLTEGHCALLIKNTGPTSLGNKDVADMIDAIHLGDGIRLGLIEEKGTFDRCQDGADINFWLRDSLSRDQ
jgi:hypothetical protein